MNDKFLLAFYNYLVKMSPRLIERIYAATNFATGMLIPTNADGQSLPYAATQYEIMNIDVKGETDEAAHESQEFPEVEVTIGKDAYKTMRLPVAFSYTEDEVEASNLAASNGAQLAGELISQRPTDAAMNVILRRANIYAAYGKGTTSGLLNNPLVPTDTSTFDPYATTTSDQSVIDWLVNWSLAIKKRNNLEDDELWVPDTLLLPMAMEQRMSRVIVQNNPSDMTLEEKFLKSQKNFTKIHYSNLLGGPALEKYGVQPTATNRDRLMFYRRDPRFVERLMSKVHVYRPSYSKGVYWSGFAQKFTQTIIHMPQFMQLVTFSNTNSAI
jgi:hypothetical protein